MHQTETLNTPYTLYFTVITSFTITITINHMKFHSLYFPQFNIFRYA